LKRVTWLGWAAMSLLCLYVAQQALRYLRPDFAGPEFIMANAMANPWLPIHAGAAAIGLVIGAVQLLPMLRRHVAVAHRWLGRAYMACCLTAGVSGLALAAGTTAGPIAQAGFTGLGIAVLVCSGQAWRHARGRRFDQHRAWVIRSYALIFAGVTLRLWLPLVFIAELDFMESYRVIAWLAWVPNLLAGELYLATNRRRESARGLA
jgi:uncharacterized membrane protein